MRPRILAALVVAACSPGEDDTVGFTPPPPSAGAETSTGASTDATTDAPPTTGEPDPTSADPSTTGGSTGPALPGSTDDTGPAETTAATTDATTTTGGDESTETGAAGVVASVVIDDAGPVQVGMLGALTATAFDGQGQPVPDVAISWRSGDGLVLYVDGDGGLLGVSPGMATVTASADGVSSEPAPIVVLDHVPPAATFTEVQTLALGSCALAGCHVDGVEAGDLRWDRPAEKMYDVLVDEEADSAPALMRVRPDEPEASFLIHKLALEAPQAGARMPLGGPPLPAAQAQVFVRWIVAGAPFN